MTAQTQFIFRMYLLANEVTAIDLHWFSFILKYCSALFGLFTWKDRLRRQLWTNRSDGINWSWRRSTAVKENLN